MNYMFVPGPLLGCLSCLLFTVDFPAVSLGLEVKLGTDIITVLGLTFVVLVRGCYVDGRLELVLCFIFGWMEFLALVIFCSILLLQSLQYC